MLAGQALRHVEDVVVCRRSCPGHEEDRLSVDAVSQDVPGRRDGLCVRHFDRIRRKQVVDVVHHAIGDQEPVGLRRRNEGHTGDEACVVDIGGERLGTSG